MFARSVEMVAQPGKSGHLVRTINDQVLPILKSQTGFVDEIVLISPEKPDEVIGVSLWQTRQDAERYNRDTFPKVNDLIRNLAEGPPQVRTFDVEISTGHKIVAGKAA